MRNPAGSFGPAHALIPASAPVRAPARAIGLGLARALTLVFAASSFALAFAPAEFAHRSDLLFTSGSAVSQFHSVQVTLDTAALVSAGTMRPDAADLAVAWDADGSGAWIELDAHPRPAPNTTFATSAATEVWFAIPDPAGLASPSAGIAVASGSVDRYRIYYGRPSATLAERRRDGAQVYRFFDDFNGGGVNAAVWYLHPSYALAVTVAGGILKQDGALSPGAVWQGPNIRMTTQTAAGVPTFSVSYGMPFVVESRFRTLDLADDVRPVSYLQHMPPPGQPYDHDEYTTFLHSNGAQSVRLVKVRDGVGSLLVGNATVVSPASWYDLATTVKLTDATPGAERALHALTLNGTFLGNSGALPRGGYDASITSGVIGIETDPGTSGEYDWILVRDAAVNPPVAIADPFLDLRVRQLDAGTEVTWSAPGDAGSYDVVRGELGALSSGATGLLLGNMTCLANDLAATSTAPVALDTEVPGIGEVVYYLVRANGSSGPGSWGASSAGFLRVVSAGGCAP